MLFLMFLIGFSLGLILSKYFYARLYSEKLALKLKDKNHPKYWSAIDTAIPGFIGAGILIMFLDGDMRVGWCFIGIGMGIFIYFSLNISGFLKIKKK